LRRQAAEPEEGQERHDRLQREQLEEGVGVDAAAVTAMASVTTVIARMDVVEIGTAISVSGAEHRRQRTRTAPPNAAHPR
jgi:hypothetical protein